MRSYWLVQRINCNDKYREDWIIWQIFIVNVIYMLTLFIYGKTSSSFETFPAKKIEGYDKIKNKKYICTNIYHL